MNEPRKCEEIEGRLSAYVRGELAPEETDAIRAHLETCPACREAADAMSLLHHAMEAAPAPQRLDDLRRLRVYQARRVSDDWAKLQPKKHREPIPLFWVLARVAVFVLLPLVVMVGLLMPATQEARVTASRAQRQMEVAVLEAESPSPASKPATSTLVPSDVLTVQTHGLGPAAIEEEQLKRDLTVADIGGQARGGAAAVAGLDVSGEINGPLVMKGLYAGRTVAGHEVATRGRPAPAPADQASRLERGRPAPGSAAPVSLSERGRPAPAEAGGKVPAQNWAMTEEREDHQPGYGLGYGGGVLAGKTASADKRLAESALEKQKTASAGLDAADLKADASWKFESVVYDAESGINRTTTPSSDRAQPNVNGAVPFLGDVPVVGELFAQGGKAPQEFQGLKYRARAVDGADSGGFKLGPTDGLIDIVKPDVPKIPDMDNASGLAASLPAKDSFKTIDDDTSSPSAGGGQVLSRNAVGYTAVPAEQKANLGTGASLRNDIQSLDLADGGSVSGVQAGEEAPDSGSNAKKRREGHKTLPPTSDESIQKGNWYRREATPPDHGKVFQWTATDASGNAVSGEQTILVAEKGADQWGDRSEAVSTGRRSDASDKSDVAGNLTVVKSAELGLGRGEAKPAGPLSARVIGQEYGNGEFIQMGAGGGADRSRALAEADGRSNFAAPEPPMPKTELEKKLKSIVLPSLEFREADMQDVVKALEDSAAKLDPEGKGVAIDLAKHEEGRGETEGIPAISLNMRQVSALDALKYITEMSGQKYRVEGDRVVIEPEGVVSGRLETRMYPTQPSFVDAIVERSGEESGTASGSTTLARADVKDFFVRAGVPFPEGTSLSYDLLENQLVVANTPENLDLFDRVIEGLTVVTNGAVMPSDLSDTSDVSDAPRVAPPREPAGFNPYVDSSANAFSTFSIDVDTASYTLTRRALSEGRLPDPEEVRTEEIVNAFDYDYAAPTRDAFAIRAEWAPSPFRPPLEILKVGIQGKVIGRDAKRPAVLTIVVDGSGSMDAPDRLGRIRRALAMLAEQLEPRDTVAIVQFSDTARLVLDRVPGSNKKAVLAALDALTAAGSTQLEGGLKLGYEVAARGYASGCANRVILLSDGVANLGAATAGGILATIDRYRRQGIYLTVLGFGGGDYDDAMLEQLADKGDGFYAYVDSDDEARRLLVDQWDQTLRVIARDVKIQVEFSPDRVKRWRQVGYENRRLNKEDFRNDAVDAGEVGSGQAVTALYDLEIAGDSDRPLATVRVRYRDPDSGIVTELERRVTVADRYLDFERAPPRFRLAACAAEFAELLRVSPYTAGSDYSAVADRLRPVAQELPLDQRVRELVGMVGEAGRGSRVEGRQE
jgi:Ca-activated chloride channel homolog